jgi:hypothetical protein
MAAYLKKSLPADWDRSYALAMIQGKRGSCYHDAAAFAHLASKATGYPVVIALGKSTLYNPKGSFHAWVLIRLKGKWYIYDPNGDRIKGKGKGKYMRLSLTSALAKGTYQKEMLVTVK